MKQKIVLFIITVAMVVSCMAVAGAATNDPDDNWGDIIENPWANLFTETPGNITDIPWDGPTTKAAETKAEPYPAKAVIKKIYKKKYSSKKIKMSVKKAKNALGYQVVVFKTKKNARKLVKPLYQKVFLKAKFTLKSKKLKNKKKLFVRVRGFNRTKVGPWSKIKRVKIKKK